MGNHNQRESEDNQDFQIESQNQEDIEDLLYGNSTQSEKGADLLNVP